MFEGLIFYGLSAFLIMMLLIEFNYNKTKNELSQLSQHKKSKPKMFTKQSQLEGIVKDTIYKTHNT